MNTDISWLNMYTGNTDQQPPGNADYGIDHSDSSRDSVNSELEQTEYEPARSSIVRKKYLKEYGPRPLLGDMIEKVGGRQADWPAPSVKGYMYCNFMLRRFLLANRAEKIFFLLHKMGLDEIGMIVKDDALFVYEYSTEPTQLQLYLSVDEVSHVTELTRTNHSMMTELKISIEPYGLLYIFFQLYADQNRVDFNKLDMRDFPEHLAAARKILDVTVEIPSIDRIPFQLFHPLNEISEEAWDAKLKNIVDEFCDQPIMSLGEVNRNIHVKLALEELDITGRIELIEQLDVARTIENVGAESGSIILSECVNSLIPSKNIAKQFVLEELDTAQHGNNAAKKFSLESGIEEKEFNGSMANSFPEVDGEYGPQKTLINLLKPLYTDISFATKMRILTVDNIMKIWALGKYSNKNETS